MKLVLSELLAFSFHLCSHTHTQTLTELDLPNHKPSFSVCGTQEECLLLLFYNEPERWRLVAQTAWQQMKHAKLHSDVLQASKEGTFGNSGFSFHRLRSLCSVCVRAFRQVLLHIADASDSRF